MAKTRKEKQKIMNDLKERLKEEKSIVMIDFSGVNSDFLFDLRGKLKKEGCLLKVIKKTLLEKTLEGLKMNDIARKIRDMKIQVALVMGSEEGIKSSKICYQKSKEDNKLKIIGGIIEDNFLTDEKMIELAQLPSKEEILSKLVGTVNNPILKFNCLFQNNIKGLINVLSNIR